MKKWVIGGVALLLLINVGLWAWLGEKDEIIAEINAENISEALREAGFMEALETRDKELGTLSVELAAIRAEMEAAGARPLAEADIVSTSVAASVPGGATDSEVAFGVKARYSGLIGSNGRGGIFAKGSFWVTLDGEGWTKAYQLSVDGSESEFRVGSTLSQALAHYADRPQRISLKPRPLRHWRAGLVAGAGLCLGRDYVTNLCLFAGYGVQF